MKACKRCEAPVEDNRHIVCTALPEDQGKEPFVTYICCECDDKERMDKYLESGEITTSLMTDAILTECDEKFGKVPKNKEFYDKVNADLKEIFESVVEFSNMIWIPKIRPYIQKAEYKGHERTHPTFKIMAYAMCGRVMVTIQDRYGQADERNKFGGANVSLIGAEDGDGGIGLNALCATKQEAIGLIKSACNRWRDLEPEPDVRIAGT
jgi:hypothetical protein